MNDVNRGQMIRKCLMMGALLMLLFTETFSTIHGADANKPITLSNKYYEVAVDPSNGSIIYILDQKTRQKTSTGNRDGILWGALTNYGKRITGSDEGTSFKYTLAPGAKMITLNYQGKAPNLVDVTVIIEASGDQSFTMQAVVNNRSELPIETFQFPYNLNVAEEQITDALLPMIPGVKLRSAFFTNHQSYDALYPGVMFADYVAVHSKLGKISLYSQIGTQAQPVNLGFAHDSNNPGNTCLIHHYRTWIESGKQWTTPRVVIRIGQDYPETIAAYRRENGIQNFKSLADKLGTRKQQYFESPLYKMDFNMLKKSFIELKTAVIDHLPVPGLIHPVAFQPGGHDRNYPDFIPPADVYGTTESLAELVKYAQNKGNLVIPYTNFSWWNTDSPTLKNLPDGITPPQIAVNQKDGSAAIENYGSDGYVIHFENDFVAKRIAAEHDKLLKTTGFDGIFEDQLGARDARYDFNPAGQSGLDPATSYFEGVLAHTQALAKNNLITECGIDRLAGDEIGFMGTNLLWDLLGYRKATVDYSDYYPMIGMLCRDKVLLYQHNLAIETWTDDKEMFRWNLAFGYNFSSTLNDLNNPWLPLIGVFQKYVLSCYADQLVTGFTNLENQVTCTTFTNYKTYANWDPQNTFTQSGHVVAPGGALVVAGDGAVTAGVFTAYNGNILGEGDHYLIEVRSKDNIKVFQPIGPNTPIHIKKYSSWPGVKIEAYGYDGKPITEIDPTTLKDDVLFDWNRECSDQTVAWYQLTKANQPNTQGFPIPKIPDLVVTDITWSPADVASGDIAIGDQVTFQATVKNIGTGPTPAGTILGIAFEIDGKPQFWSEYFKEPLAAGAIITLKVSRGESKPLWEATAGPHVITVWVDKTNKINEIIENNNRFSKNIPSIDEAVLIDGVRKPRSAVNLALNKPVVSSGATAPAYKESLVNDGFTNSYWESVNKSFPAYLTIDLGTIQTINRVVLKLPPSWEQRVQTIELQGSAANLEFTKILDAAKYTFDPASQNTVSISIPKTGVRFLKLIFTGNTGWPAGQLAEVEVFSGN